MCILANVIQASSAPTVEFIIHINHLFDSLNGTNKNPQKGNEYHCAIKEGLIHQYFWNEMLQFIDSWVFVHTRKNVDKWKQNPGPLNRKGWL